MGSEPRSPHALLRCCDASGAAGKWQGCGRGLAYRERSLLQAGWVLLACVFSKLSFIQMNAWICAWLQAFISIDSVLVIDHYSRFSIQNT